MKGFRDKGVASKCCSKPSTETTSNTSSLEPGSKSSLWSSFLASAFSIFETYNNSDTEKKPLHSRANGWTSAVKKVVSAGSMRRIHERVLGPSRTGISNSTSDIWLLGQCYKLSQNESPAADANGLAAFYEDFSSRIIITYRKGFTPIGDSNLTSDVGWGCMVRSSQMLVAQALLFHHLGRSWRKKLDTPLDSTYIEILHLFGDSEASVFSLHNLLQSGKAYGLAAGSWVGPYAMCRSWEFLARSMKEGTGLGCHPLPMAIYVVSGDEDGERGGAPVACIEDASRHCREFSKGQSDWTPILLLVPLVLGLEKINPRYVPSLRLTFTFPQSLGILGGKPGASTYIVGVQEENAIYLDPHEVQPVVNISKESIDADTSSYHSNNVKHIPFESIDPSLALGFYCRDKDDFDDFCSRASKLAEESNGAPLFTVAETHKKPVNHNDMLDDIGDAHDGDSLGVDDVDGNANEDDWQLL